MRNRAEILQMKNDKQYLYLFLRTPGIILMFILLFIAGNNAFAQKKKSNKKVPELEVNFGLATIYDDNILKYSQKYLDRFMNGEDFGRFHIETYDDVILNPTLQLVTTYRLFGKLKSELTLDFNPKYYVVNNIKNWSSFTLGYRQFFTKRASFKLTYNYVPDFYIRHFRDDDWVEVYGYVPETFQPMGFAKNQYGFYVQNTFFKNTLFRLSLNLAQYFYNQHFIEYDSKDYSIGYRLIQPIAKNFKLELGYVFTKSNAKGYDGPGESKDNSDDSDADFDEDGFFLIASWQMPDVFKLKTSLEANGGFEKRYYTTNHYVVDDPEHAGRVDNILSFGFNYNLKINKPLQLSAFYRWIGRDSSTSSPLNSEYVSVEKDYRQGQVGIEIDYSLNY